jgi:hypothetical protein
LGNRHPSRRMARFPKRLTVMKTSLKKAYT